MPSVKYAFCLSSLRFSNGRTAMLLFDTAGTAAPERPRPHDRKEIDNAITNASADRIKAVVTIDFDQVVAATGLTLTLVFCFHRFLPVSFWGRFGFPSPSLQRLTMPIRKQCFTSHSPRSCK